jgi:hypothetical protein
LADNVFYFENIQARPPVQSVLFRLGYKNGMTQVPETQLSSIDNTIKEGFSLCELKGAYAYCNVLSVTDSSVVITGGIEFKSKGLAALFQGCTRALLLAATAGKTITRRRDGEVGAGNGSTALIFDAAASETADYGLDWMQEMQEKQLVKKSIQVTRRFSPGYGDLELSNQKPLYGILGLEKIGISINDRFILEPEKSVIGLCGIR